MKLFSGAPNEKILTKYSKYCFLFSQNVSRSKMFLKGYLCKLRRADLSGFFSQTFKLQKDLGNRIPSPKFLSCCSVEWSQQGFKPTLIGRTLCFNAKHLSCRKIWGTDSYSPNLPCYEFEVTFRWSLKTLAFHDNWIQFLRPLLKVFPRDLPSEQSNRYPNVLSLRKMAGCYYWFFLSI